MSAARISSIDVMGQIQDDIVSTVKKCMIDSGGPDPVLKKGSGECLLRGGMGLAGTFGGRPGPQRIIGDLGLLLLPDESEQIVYLVLIDQREHVYD